MSTSEKKRIAKEADYLKKNDDVKSICPGVFYIKNKKTYETCKNCTKCFKFKEYNEVKDKEKRPEVNFYYVDSFRKCEYYKVKPIQGEDIALCITYTILYVNDMACNYVMLLEPAMRNVKDKKLKLRYKEALKLVKDYLNMLYKIPQIEKNINFLAEFNGNMDDVSDFSAEDLESKMRELYTEMKVEDPEFLSKVEMARTIVEYSVRSANKMVSQGVKYDGNILTLQKFILTDLYKKMEVVSDRSFKRVKSSINMSADPRIIKAYRDLNEKLINFEKISECLMKAENTCNGVDE